MAGKRWVGEALDIVDQRLDTPQSCPHLISNLLALGGVAAAGWVLRPDVALHARMAAGLAAHTGIALLWWPQVNVRRRPLRA